jgi:hypothetical protein
MAEMVSGPEILTTQEIAGTVQIIASINNE